MNIMIVTNSAYLKSTYIMLYSLFLQHHQEKMNIYLPYEDISENELAELTAFVESYAGKKNISTVRWRRVQNESTFEKWNQC